jgi:hypothetical protein
VRGLAGANLTRTIPPLPDERPAVMANGIVIDVEHIRGFLAAAGCQHADRAADPVGT